MRGQGAGYAHMRTARNRPLLPLPPHAAVHAQMSPIYGVLRATRVRTAGGEQQLSAAPAH